MIVLSRMTLCSLTGFCGGGMRAAGRYVWINQALGQQRVRQQRPLLTLHTLGVESKRQRLSVKRRTQPPHSHNTALTHKLLRTCFFFCCCCCRSKEVHSYLRQMGSSPEAVVDGRQVEDMVVLPQAAFGCNFRYWSQDNVQSVVYHMFANSWKKDHYKVADAKKIRRQEKEREAAMQQRRVLYPLLFIASACGGVGLALYSGSMLGSVDDKRQWRMMSPYALLLGGSPYGSPNHSPSGSPPPKGSSNSRAARQRQSPLDLLYGLGSTRKSARLVQ